MGEKKFIRSKIAIACYVIAGLLLVYTFYTIGSTVAYLASYFEAYGTTLSANFGDSITYILQSTCQPLAYTVLIFMAGYILETIRRGDLKNYMTAEELKQLAEQKAALKAAKAEAKKAAAEAKKALAEAKIEEKKALDAPAEEAAAEAEKEAE